MRLALAVAAGLTVFSVLPYSTRQAAAAVRKCGEIVAVAGEDKADQAAAKRKALTGWTQTAAQLGPAFILWRNASDRSLSCLMLVDGTHRCQAYGRPCGVAQNPSRLPPGTLLPPALARRPE